MRTRIETNLVSKVGHCFKGQNTPPVVHRKPKIKHNQNQFSFGSLVGRYYVVPISTLIRKANGSHI